MVERNVLVSNLTSLLDAATSGMIDLLSRIPKAQKATSYGWKNKCASKGENSAKCAGKSALPPDENNGFTI
jgi:hypothetical protein